MSSEINMIRNLQKQIDRIVDYLKPNMNFINCHMVSYLTDNFWETFIPHAIRNEVEKHENPMKEIIQECFWNTGNTDKKKFPILKEFIENSSRLRLENMQDITTTVKDLLERSTVNKNLHRQNKQLQIKAFMSEKKGHEVEIVSSLINDLLKTQEENSNIFIVDAGDGKGYLSSRLALEYKNNVLGIDAREENTENAIKRNKKLERAWDTLTKRAELISQGIAPPRHGRKNFKELRNVRNFAASSNNYKTVNHFITPETDFIGLIKDAFARDGNEELQIFLTGLHTCGNLGPTCLKSFVQNDFVKILCNIGCCYHHITEEFPDEYFSKHKHSTSNDVEVNFPLSQHLRNQHFKLGRNARMLACQSIHRVFVNKELPHISLFYRALLEVIIMEKLPERKNCVKVGKIRNYEDFKAYVRKCNKNLNLNLDYLTDNDLENYLNRFATNEHLLNIFYLIRMTFSSIIETLILLDRLMYLKENRLSNSYLVSLFDPVISPRSYGIIAIK